MPPDSSRGSFAAKSPRPTSSQQLPARARGTSPDSAPTSSAGSSTFSRIVRHFSSTGAWNTMPTSGIGPVTGAPATLTRPDVTGRSPATMRSRVDLPQPLGPTSDDELAGAESPSEMPRSASTGPLAAS